MSKVLITPGNAVEYVVGQQRTFIPVKNCRSILVQNIGSNNVKFGGMTIEPNKSFNIDVYPGESIAGQWSISGTSGDIIEILQLVPQ